jgi:hypothetical protein
MRVENAPLTTDARQRVEPITSTPAGARLDRADVARRRDRRGRPAPARRGAARCACSYAIAAAAPNG